MAIAPGVRAQEPDANSSPDSTQIDSRAYAVNALLSSAACEFKLGFKVMHDLIPGEMGNCINNEHERATDGTGDEVQDTEKGLLVWRHADNWTAFTNGYWTWINGPQGLQKRLNTERFDWEKSGPPVPSKPVQSDNPAPIVNQGINFDIGPGVSSNDQDTARQGFNIARSFYESLGMFQPPLLNINLDTASGEVFTIPSNIYIHTGSPTWIARSVLGRKLTVAHEDFHAVQKNLYGNPPPAGLPDWMSEGTAEFMSFSAFAASGLLSMDDVQKCQVDLVKKAGSRSLSDLEQSWSSSGGYPRYQESALAAQLLASRNGLGSLKNFFSNLQMMDYSNAFRNAFGVSPGDFSNQFNNNLQGQQGDTNACAKVPF